MAGQDDTGGERAAVAAAAAIAAAAANAAVAANQRDAYVVQSGVGACGVRTRALASMCASPLGAAVADDPRKGKISLLRKKG